MKALMLVVVLFASVAHANVELNCNVMANHAPVKVILTTDSTNHLTGIMINSVIFAGNAKVEDNLDIDLQKQVIFSANKDKNTAVVFHTVNGDSGYVMDAYGNSTDFLCGTK